MAELFHVRGLDEVKRLFAQAPKEVGKRVLRRGASAGARTVKAGVLPLVPVGKRAVKRGRYLVQPGTLKRAAIVKFIREQSNEGQAVFYVTFRQGRKQQAGGRDAYYAKWVERGHRIIARFKGKYTDFPLRGRGRLTGLAKRRRSPIGFVQGVKFLARGFAASKSQATRAIVVGMQDEFERIYGRR